MQILNIASGDVDKIGSEISRCTLPDVDFEDDVFRQIQDAAGGGGLSHGCSLLGIWIIGREDSGGYFAGPRQHFIKLGGFDEVRSRNVVLGEFGEVGGGALDLGGFLVAGQMSSSNNPLLVSTTK